MNQAGVYAGTLHYLKAVAALKSAADGKAVVAKMKKMPTDDPAFGKGTVAPDGRVLHPAYLFEVKKPEESKYPRDFYKLTCHDPRQRSVPSAQGWRLPDGERLIAIGINQQGGRTHEKNPRNSRRSPRFSPAAGQAPSRST